jgi:hypothetical protein
MSLVKKMGMTLFSLLVVLLVFQADMANAAQKSNSDTQWYLYTRSGQYLGGFDLHVNYVETYDDYGATTWKIHNEYSYTTVSDSLLSLNYYEQYTRFFEGSTLKYTINNASFPWCSSYIYDPNKITICKESKNVYYAAKGKIRSEHTSLITLPTNYSPQIYTMRINLSY